MKKHQDKTTAETSETKKKKLLIKTSATQPEPGPELPCTSFTW